MNNGMSKLFRNTTVKWFRQIILSGCQLSKFLEEIEKKCNDLNKHRLDYDYQEVDDFLDGRISVSLEGVHYVPQLYNQYGSPTDFEEGEFDTSTKVLKPIEELQILTPCNSVMRNEHGYQYGGGMYAYRSAPNGVCCDLAPVAGSSPRSFDSIPSTYLDDSHSKLIGNWFRQIISLVIRHTILPVTNHIPILQPPTFYIPGAPGPKSHAAPQRFVRPKEVALGVSFNTQSQATDIPGISSCAAFSQYSASLQAQSKVPDIHFLSLSASTEELLASFNTQDQAPDDPYTQDRQCAPCDFVENSLHSRQVLSRLPTGFHQVLSNVLELTF